MPKVAIFGPFGSGQFEVHDAACTDCKKAAERARAAACNWEWPLVADSALSVSLHIFQDIIKEGSMTAEDGLQDIVFKPCVRF